ncbi:hypothetical protein GWK48_10470 [Metallosphaera tengchongensis]|uniref:Uncharacterized protein n=1 Tax=Metallosphaera tengchongensis TaxID=1532350 RepID=A0A6N0NVC2_9CREN|nr:hypothetical protein [Metallosphaera tengchongensis]QKR00756.1 hypothetical protein GWK48_10470 [Metallosphaera tengchongensis]
MLQQIAQRVAWTAVVNPVAREEYTWATGIGIPLTGAFGVFVEGDVVY